MRKALLIPAAAAVMTLGLCMQAAAETKTGMIIGGKYVSSPASADNTAIAVSEASFDVESFDIPDTAELVISLKGEKDSDAGILTVYEKTESGTAGKSSWKDMLQCTARYGKNGLYKEREGDSKTPVGVFLMDTPFGIAAAGEGFPDEYIRVDESYYWNGDSASDSYNELVRDDGVISFDRAESEHLIDYAPYYNYCINTGYNTDNTAFRGSAIFLHCAVNNENTHGCIAVPETDMLQIMKMYKKGRTYMLIYDAAKQRSDTEETIKKAGPGV